MPVSAESRHAVAQDGRPYPEHLRAFERYDKPMLELVTGASQTFNEIAAGTDDSELQAVLARWLTSAQWRGLVQHIPSTDADAVDTFHLTAAAEHLRAA
jgi:hypothetical protein